MVMCILVLYTSDNTTYINILFFKSWKHSSGDALNVVLMRIHHMYRHSDSRLICVAVSVE
jgi:hypothetical protein